jgi:hypothetical protein
MLVRTAAAIIRPVGLIWDEVSPCDAVDGSFTGT